MNIIITSPSINIQSNVSGIASLTKLFISLNKDVNYLIFELGKSDKDRRGVVWFAKQLFIPIRFFLLIKESKPDFIHLNVPFNHLAIVRDLVLAIIADVCNKPVLLHIRGGRLLIEPCNHRILRYFIGLILKKAKRIIVLGHREKQQLLNFFCFISEDNIFVLPNAVKVASKEIPREKNINAPLRLLFIGRLDKNKGLPEIERALLTLKEKDVNFLLSICGDGPYKDIFLKKMHGQFKNQIVFHGVVDGIEKNNIIKKADIFLLPSYFEGLPNSMLETMAQFCVPIVTPVGSIPEVITNGQNGIIVPVHNSIKIAEAISNLDHNREFLKILSLNAYSTIFNNYNIDNYFIRLNCIYDGII